METKWNNTYFACLAKCFRFFGSTLLRLMSEVNLTNDRLNGDSDFIVKHVEIYICLTLSVLVPKDFMYAYAKNITNVSVLLEGFP